MFQTCLIFSNCFQTCTILHSHQYPCQLFTWPVFFSDIPYMCRGILYFNLHFPIFLVTNYIEHLLICLCTIFAYFYHNIWKFFLWLLFSFLKHCLLKNIIKKKLVANSSIYFYGLCFVFSSKQYVYPKVIMTFSYVVFQKFCSYHVDMWLIELLLVYDAGFKLKLIFFDMDVQFFQFSTL